MGTPARSGSIALIMVLLSVGAWAPPSSAEGASTGISGTPGRCYLDFRLPREKAGSADPAEAYCRALGYDYEIVGTEAGQRGVCVFPDGSRCDAWDFLRGKCGQEHSFCARNGLGIETRDDGRDPFSREYAVCVGRGGAALGSVSELVGLDDLVIRAATRSPERHPTEPAESPVGIGVRYPPSFDWRDHDGQDWMTPVRNQGGCGSCWAFGAIGTVEATHNISAGDPTLDLDLSEEYLVSNCADYGDCCGGWHTVLEYVLNQGVADEVCMPYVSGSGCYCSEDCGGCAHPSECSNTTCWDRCDDWYYRLTRIDTVSVLEGADACKTYISEHGPISIGMGVGGDCGGYWDGDVYRCTDDSCVNHCIVIVGYDDAGGYWIAKNSWGTGFGEDGYFKLGYGECGFTAPRGAGLDVDWVDVTAGPLGDSAATNGVAWGDYDGDGDPDLYLATGGGPDRLLRNDGAGAFTDVTNPPLGQTGSGTGAAWGDYDNDGDPDLYVAVEDGANRLYRNDGGSLIDVTAPPLGDAAPGMGVAWGDYDRDGLLDLYLVNSGANRLFRNLGGGSFADATAPPLDDAGDGRGAAWGDHDDDGDLDLYVANHTSGNKLFENLGGGLFADATSSPLDDTARSTGVAWGDLDNDGDLDLYVANADADNRLFRNLGGGSFADAHGAGECPGASCGVTWADFDNDKDLDLYVGNDGEPNLLLLNYGSGTLTSDDDRVTKDPGHARAVAWADYDGDGDLDLYVANNAEENRLFRNDSSGPNHWLQVALEGLVSNRGGIGARITIAAPGYERTRELSAGSGFFSQNQSIAAFGLGSIAAVDSVVVRWPSGLRNVLRDVAADQVVTIVENLAPSAPGGVAVAPGEGSALLSWSAAPDTDVVYYAIERDTSAAFGEAAVALSSADTTYLDAPLLGVHEYFYRVTAVDRAGNAGSPSDTVSCVPDQNPPPTPEALTADVEESMVTLAWDPADVPDLTHYDVERDTTVLFGPDTATFASPDTSYVDFDVTNEEEYFYRVIAVDFGGFESTPSNTVSVVPPNLPPSPPTGVVAASGGGVVDLTWDANPELDIAGYSVARGTVPDFAAPDSISFIVEPPFIDGGCEIHRIYWYSVRAVDLLDVESAPSDTVLGVGVEGDAVYVNAAYSGPEIGSITMPFDRIDEGVEEAEPGDAVLVLPGVYPGNIDLKSGVVVIGLARATQTVIEGPVIATGVDSTALLAGFTIDGLGVAPTGLDCAGSDLSVEECTIKNATTGASFHAGGSPTLTGNLFTTNQTGVACADSARPLLVGNTFAGNTFTNVSVSVGLGPVVGGSLAAANDFIPGAAFMTFNTGGATIAAEYNFWGDVCFDPSWFFGPIDYAPWTDATHTEVYTECPTGVSEDDVPTVYSLDANAPNPFNPSTRIAFGVPAPGGDVTLAVYNAAGRSVRTLVDGFVPAGRHTTVWDGLDRSGRPVSSGVYFARLQAGGFRGERKILLLK